MAQKRLTPRVGKVLPEPPAEPMRVNMLDLPGDQVRRIELEGGTRLGQVPLSVQQHLAAVTAAVYDVDYEATQALSLRMLARYIVLTDDESDDEPGND